MNIENSARLKKLPPYLFVEFDRLTKEAKERGIDVISFGIGDPDLATPKPIIDAFNKAVQNKENHRYPLGSGSITFRKAIADWYKKRFSVEIDASNEVIALIGSKEGIGHIPLAFVNLQDIALIPDPGYPVYQSGTIFAGGIPYYMPLTKKNNWLPDLEAIPTKILKKTKIMFINYPNNPTGAIATKSFFKDVVKLAKRYNFIVCHDAAYSEIYFEEHPNSIMQIDGAKDAAVEFHSLSKTFSMTGWRVGFAVGNKNIIEGLSAVKNNIDSGVFGAIQEAASFALSMGQDEIKEIRKTYESRMKYLVEGLKSFNWKVDMPKASFYLWIEIPKKYNKTSMEFAKYILKQTGIVMIPGVGFGRYGEGYVRMSVTLPENRIKEAIERLKKLWLRI